MEKSDIFSMHSLPFVQEHSEPFPQTLKPASSHAHRQLCAHVCATAYSIDAGMLIEDSDSEQCIHLNFSVECHRPFSFLEETQLAHHPHLHLLYIYQVP